MTNKYLIILLLIITSSCSLNKVVNHHGVHFLEKKQIKLFENITNKNEISQILGPPLVKSYFDNNIWIFIERKSSVSSLRYLGKEKLIINDILVLEINNRGILVKKTFHDKESMKKIKMSSETTSTVSVKDSFIQQTLKISERKMNDPLGTKSAK